MTLPLIALNMIVKDESHVIDDLLRSVAPFIHYWTIVDTGSTDDTPNIIERTFAELGINGQLYHRPWKDFGWNRSEALALARGTAQYHFVIDADDTVHGAPDLSNLVSPAYYVRFGGQGSTYYRQQLFRDDLPWRYEGILHEYPTCDVAIETEYLQGDFYITSGRTGARSRDPFKYSKDAELLEQALAKDPGNTRYQFYLGQSYFDAKEYEKAIEAYRTRVTQKGYEEEVFWSLYRIGLALIEIERPIEIVVGAMLAAYQFRPSRAESLHSLAFYLRAKKQFDLAALMAMQATMIPRPDDLLFVDRSIYHHKAFDELAVSGYYSTNLKRAGYDACKSLVVRAGIPEAVRERSLKNLTLYQDNLGFS
jgi:glycosyltransferase involved in cell wall biosynthesis